MKTRGFLGNIFNIQNTIEKPDVQTPWNTPHRQSASLEDIFYCFRLILGRSPNREEWTGHAAQAESDLNSVVGIYVNSLEFSRRLSVLRDSKLDDRISLIDLEEFSMYVQDNDSAVGLHIKNRNAYEPHVTAIFRDRLKPGMNVLDIGANIGYFTMLSAFLVKSIGSVMAIEPNAANAKLLEASRRANSFDNVVVVQAAAGREIGLLVLNASHSNGTTAQLSDNVRSLIDSITVPSLKLDDLIPANKNIDFIKIDVEGAEYNAMLGAAGTIKRCKPIIASEYSPDLMTGISGVSGTEYLQFLIDLGYRISIIEQNGNLTDCDKDPAKINNAYRQSGVDHIDILLDPAV